MAAGALSLGGGDNHPPEWDPSTPKDPSGEPEKAITFTVRANDVDNDPITYSLSGLPKDAKAEPMEGAIRVTWTPTDDDVGVHTVIATASDGKTSVTRSIRVIVEEEHESYFMPGVGATVWVPADTATYGVFTGFRIEVLGVRWVHQNEKRGPSHGRIWLAFDVLFSTHSAVDPAFMPLLGFDLSLEKNPGRRWLIPYFGMDGGAVFQKQTGTLGLMTAFLGLHLWSGRNVEIGLEGGCLLPFTSEQFSQLIGFRGRLSADLSFW